MQFIPTQEFNKIKTRKDFDESLKVQKQQLSILEIAAAKAERKITKGMFNTKIPSPRELYQRSRAQNKALYPHIYEEKINKAAFMSSDRVVGAMKEKEGGEAKAQDGGN